MRALRIVATAILLLTALGLGAAVRPISDAEHAAVQIAAAYLHEGPSAVAAKLASTSPLRAFSPAEQLAEIEVRLGPPQGAQWELQTVVPALDRLAAFGVTYPAGSEDHVIFEMVAEGGVMKVQDLRFLAQPSELKPLFAPLPENETAPEQSAAFITFRGAAVAAGVLAAVLSALASIFARNRTLSRVAIAFALVLVAAMSTVVVREDRVRIATAGATAIPKRTEGPPRLAPLLPLRRALANGGGLDAAFAAVDRSEGRGAIADLWKIQTDLLQVDTANAKATLARFPLPSNRPLAELLRGRVAILENDEVAAALAFERAVNLGPGRDALWFENADALYAMGFEARARASYERVARIGSRDADVYYALASIAAADGKDDDAEKHLRQAWSMRPVERERLIGAGAFWSVLRRPAVMELIGFSAATEALVRSAATSTRPAVFPPSAESRLSGEFLQVTLGEQKLLVPGGAALAPPSTPVVEPSAWSEAEEQHRLADLPSLLAAGTSAAAYAQPALRQRITGTAQALAVRNRWSDVVQLTEGLTPAAEHVPPSIFFLRSIGLQRLKRTNDAKTLLAQVAGSPVLQRRRDAAALTQLAELFAAHDLHDAAVRMYDRAQSIRPNPFVDDRVRQIQMNKRLATKYSTYKTDHFEIHYPDDVSAVSAMDLGRVLESEYKRLQAWIPTPNFEPVVVNVVWWQEFRSTYTGSDYVLGFYNGKITVPFAGLSSSIPQIVTILGHELSHAMIAQSTADQAPRWFQEGFAQRVQKSDYHGNAFNMYEDKNLLPLALLDPVLHGSPDPQMIGAAYIVAHTDIRFIEAKYGRGALQRFMAAYREGATTAEAVRRVCGKSMSELEVELRAWGRAESRVFEGEGR